MRNFDRNIKLLSFAALLIFFGFNGVQHYVTSFFSDSHMPAAGFRSLILIYSFFLLASPWAAVMVSKYGAKKCMLAGAVTYALFIASLPLKTLLLVYLCSILLGIGAALLWTGQNSYLIRASSKADYGSNSGFFTSALFLGSGAGVLALGFLAARFTFGVPFLAYALFPLLALFAISKLKDTRASQEPENRLWLARKAISSSTAIRLSTIQFVVFFISGLVVGIIPLQVKNTLGVPYIGITTSLFFILPALSSSYFGKLSDRRGRKKMIIVSYLVLGAGLVFLYFSAQQSFLLIAGILLFALTWAIIYPTAYALTGDVATEENLEFVISLFWIAQNIGVLTALFASQIFSRRVEIIYIISLAAVAISAISLLPIFRMEIKAIREKLAEETS